MINPEWEALFRSRDWGKYPDLELVRFVANQMPKTSTEREKIKVLELGCGTGANLKFLYENHFDTFGIDGSPTALAKCVPYTNRMGGIEQGDVAEIGQYYAREYFNLIIDIGCFMHQGKTEREQIVKDVYDLLTPGGWFFFSEMVSDLCSVAYENTAPREDLVFVTDNFFQPKIKYHFFSEAELHTLFKPFKNFNLEISTRSYAHRARYYDRYFAWGQKP